MSCTSLQRVPVEIIIGNILPSLPIADLAHLSATNHLFHTLCADNMLWKAKLIEHFNCPLVDAWTGDYRSLYRGMRKPNVYVWGSAENGRLGLPGQLLRQGALRQYNGAPFPINLHFFRRRRLNIVQIVAGGWSFQALDSTGCLWVWGELGDHTFTADSPHRLIMQGNVKFSSIQDCSALDSESNVWIFRSWNRAHRLVSPLLRDVLQLSGGWDMGAALAKDGQVYVWWPGHGDFTTARTRVRSSLLHVSGSDHRAIVVDIEDLAGDPLELPTFGLLPDCGRSDLAEGVKIVQIACGRNFIVALTNTHQVLKIDLSLDNVPNNERMTMLRRTFRLGRGWNHLPLFSDPECMVTHPASLPGPAQVPDKVEITHLSAQLNTFVAYSIGASSVVLLGNRDATTTTQPTIISSLQQRGVISIVLGDYHRAAVTEKGELLTWGAFSQGALGLGDPRTLPPGAPGSLGARGSRWGVPPDVQVPVAITFSDNRQAGMRKFCFAAAAAGWHTAALVIDVEEA